MVVLVGPDRVARLVKIETDDDGRIRFIGTADPDTPEDQPKWEIVRITRAQVGSVLTGEMPALSGVAWSERETLPWD